MRDPRSHLLRNEVACKPLVWRAIAISLALVGAMLALLVARRVLGLAVPGPAAWALILGMGLVPLLLVRAGLLTLTLPHARRRS